ncbi:LysR family transcriptional regulator [Phenylobacterium terrae]|uniref:LysR family transcriptional regulator n=1 Tax=Phenylobacterium terrae TaxID=2665495 RepID=A0ABW4MZR1_9CAUL
MYDWNDLRVFLAVARNGSTLAASKVLKINQTTVARRLEALEEDLQLKLFERGQSGSRLTEAGEDLVAEAEKVEKAAEALASRAAAHQRGLAGTIRVTASESVANIALIPALSEFRRLYPEVTIELVMTDATLSLEDGEADVALRAGAGLPDSDALVARKLNEFVFGIYCSREYALSRGRPTRPEELKDHTLIGPDGPLMVQMPGMAWMFEQAPDAEVSCRANTMTSLSSAIKAGLGLGPMVTIMADQDPDMVRCMIPDPVPKGSMWLVTRAELRNVPRIRAFIDFVTPYVHTLARDMEAKGRAVRKAQAEAMAAAAAPMPQPELS